MKGEGMPHGDCHVMSRDVGANEPATPQIIEKGTKLSAVVDAIVTARPDLRLNRMTIENVLKGYNPTPAVIRSMNTLLAEWVNMPDPPAKPLSMLEAYLRNAEKFHADKPTPMSQEELDRAFHRRK
jgi:hypothetical protein